MPLDIAPLAIDLLHRYLERNPHERARQQILLDRLATPTGLLDRKDMRGHLTASAFVLRPSDRAVLLIHHRALNRYLQPGGHLDPDEHPLDGARREAHEETRLPLGARVLDDGLAIPFDVDSHLIPARPTKGEGAHYHFDYRYLFLAPEPVEAWCAPDAAETQGLIWATEADLPRLDLPPDLRTTLDKALALLPTL